MDIPETYSKKSFQQSDTGTACPYSPISYIVKNLLS